MSDRFEIAVHGARGSLPLAGTEGSRFGGNTSCLSVRHGPSLCILDAGTGIVPLGQALVEAQEGVAEIDILLTHAHYDHLIGLPFFAPLQRPGYKVTIWYAGDATCPDAASLLDLLARPPFLPFTRKDLRAELGIAHLPRGGRVMLAPGSTVSTVPVNHPGGALGLRLERGGRSVAYVPDFEHDDGAMDATLTGFLDRADLAFLDCTYTPEDYETHRGFGHSHWARCAEIAKAADVARWGIFHHAYVRTDAQIEAIEAAAQAVSANAFATREGMRFSL